MSLSAPFPWFGGKRRVAHRVWDAFGDVEHYVEPFAGSLAVLLGRPRWHRGRFETVNDADAYIANFWRAITHDPDGVAKWADWPVNEVDLTARHQWLRCTGLERLERMESDPDFYDAKVAGWWAWGISSWIGSGWCSVESRQRPHLGPPQGINRTSGHGIPELAQRLRQVRVCCGDWGRVLTDGSLSNNTGESVGIFLDPPYMGDVRQSNLYRIDDHSISEIVRQWCIDHGDDPRLRICLSGFEHEHAASMPPSWRVEAWTGTASYSNSTRANKNQANRHTERLWFSPHCLNPASQADLFDE